ncbi:MAG: YHS domain-containing (seleno)protein [Pseudomonadota bacterium]
MTRIAVLFLTLFLALPAAGEVRKPEVFSVLGQAIKGYDPVAYHLERRPVRGDPEISYEWNGATWLFASPANRVRFIADPERWAPQYGGYCAWAITRGRTAPVDPTIFRVVDDKLYLNLNMKVHREWLAEMPLMISRGDANWPDVLVLGK